MSYLLRLLPAAMMAGISTVAAAHSASDAYLTLTVEKGTGGMRIHGQWDVALRDLDFVMALDKDGDGHVTWKEVRVRAADIRSYVYPHLRIVGAAGVKCVLEPSRDLVDEHADGAYSALFFDVTCAGSPRKVTLHYDLFFKIDPSHRGIFVMNNGSDVSTSVLSPDNAQIDLTL